jgi:hypothetical protein
MATQIVVLISKRNLNETVSVQHYEQSSEALVT